MERVKAATTTTRAVGIACRDSSQTQKIINARKIGPNCELKTINDCYFGRELISLFSVVSLRLLFRLSRLRCIKELPRATERKALHERDDERSEIA